MGYKEWKLNDRLKSLVGKFGTCYFVQSSRYFINFKLTNSRTSILIHSPMSPSSLKGREMCLYRFT